MIAHSKRILRMTDTNMISKGEMNMNTYSYTDYSKSIERMTIESLIKLCHCKDFRENFGPYAKAKSKTNFLDLAIEKLEFLITNNQIPEQFKAIPGMDRSIAIVEKAIEDAFKGMQYIPMTPAQKALSNNLFKIEQTINLGKIAAQIFNLSHRQMIISDLELGSLMFRLVQFIDGINKIKGTLVTVAEELELKDKFIAAGKAIRQLIEAFEPIKQNLYRNNNKKTFAEGFFVKVSYNGFTINATPGCVSHLSLKSTGHQSSFKITTETFSPAYLKAISHVLVADKFDKLHRYNVSKHGSYGYDLHKMVSGISLFQALFLMSWKNVEFTSLLADTNNWCVLAPETNSMTGEEYLAVCSYAPVHPAILSLNVLGKFWGISNPDTLKKGLMKSNVAYSGFALLKDNGDILTMAEKGDFDKHGNPITDSTKTVARSMKLGKEEGEILPLGKVFLVTDCLGNELANRALSTGTVHASMAVLRKHGQCRIISTADKGGLKGTFGAMAYIDYEKSLEGISLLSFGSAKSNRYGIEKMLGLEEGAELPTENVYFDNFKGEVKGIYIDGVEVYITNNYTIETYSPTNRSALLKDWDMANEVLAARVVEKASLITEDKVFVETVLKEREDFEGDLVSTLKAMTIRGDIRKKKNTTTVTSTEFDMMTMSHGSSKTVEWMDNLLSDRLNKGDSERKVQLDRATELFSGCYNLSKTKVVPLNWFYNKLNEIGTRHNINIGSGVPQFTSRAFLVDLCLELFFFGEDYQWLVIDGQGTHCRLPLGDMMWGNFHKTSTMFESKVVMTGFVGKFLEKVAYSANLWATNNKLSLKVFGNFCENIRNEVVANTWGKDLGRLTATGLYGVMSPAWWSEKEDEVTLIGADKNYSKDKKALVCKHPLLFDMSLAGVTVKSKMPTHLTRKISKEDMEVLEFVFSKTIFCHPTMLLALQNDCDGDLTRLTWHKGFEIENFSPKTIAKGAIAREFFTKYVADEVAFDKVKATVWSNRTMVDITNAVISSGKAKANVAIYTSNAQMFAQRCELDLGLSKESNLYATLHRVLNIWVQEFSMMAIKHNQAKLGNGEESKEFGMFKVSEMKLPDYYLTSNLQSMKMTGEEYNMGEPQLVEWLNTNGITPNHHGLEDSTAFAKYVHKAMCNIKARSNGSMILGKDHHPKDVKDIEILGKGQPQDFDPRIMQDLLFLKSIGMEPVVHLTEEVLPTTDTVEVNSSDMPF